jgi:hypothetical protein
MMERFEDLAKRFGMPPSTLCAFAVADWVQRQENNAQLARMAVLDATRRGMPDADALERVLEAVMPAAVKALAQPNLSLDGEASQGGA